VTSCGLVALGDSITNGGGNMALGVYPRSWAQWLAMALELPYTSLAFDGATAPGVVLGQLPIQRAGVQQGVVGADRLQPAVLQHQDLVGVDHRRQPVRDQDQRPVAGDGVDRLPQGLLVPAVQAGGRLVQQ